MIVKNSLDEVKKRESALKIIKEIINDKGRDSLYDVTGLSGGFIASDEELNLLETYVGPAIFEDELQIVGRKHLGGEKVLAVNRTSSGILASILALVNEGDHVSHFLAEFPAHPSIPRSCAIVGASYDEFIDIDKFTIPDNTSLVVVTGSTMDHKVIDEELFKKVIDMAHEKDIPVLVDDASGARLRTAVFNQAKATELGADLVVTSTDKLMPGPRGGLMAGRKDLIDEIKVKGNQFGLEAQPPLILAMVNGIKNYTEENLIKAIDKKDELFEMA
ncbi:MAG: TIGR03576 family pyridoxal phosphate-dependent enzyme, partial [Methanobrevibacter sp.]|nr:TIGR03576 family pyridoxal phosphate-dependent enzyme [Methanobrevibacter sp.]